MLIFKDLFTDDEIINDCEPPIEVKDGEGNVVEGLLMVQSRLVSTDGGEIDTGGGNAFGGGGEDEGPDDTIETVNHLADDRVGFGYTDCDLDKATFKDCFKTYMKKVMKKRKETMKDAEDKDIENFKDWATAYKARSVAVFKYLLSKFSDLEFCMGRSQDFNAGMIYKIWEGEAAEPCFMYFKDGLWPEKC